jgi:hypothetical protein
MHQKKKLKKNKKEISIVNNIKTFPSQLFSYVKSKSISSILIFCIHLFFC